MSDDFYPMPAFATLEVADVAASIRFYEAALGFRTVFTMPGPGGQPALVHLRAHRYADLLLRAGAPTAAKGVGLTLSYAVPLLEIDARFEQARSAGATILQAVGDRPWNARDFMVADPDGFRIILTAGPVNAALSLKQVMDGTSD